MGELLSILPHTDCLSCCSIRGATNQTGPHRVLGIHFSVAIILLDVLFVFYLQLYIQTFDLLSGRKSQLALKGSHLTLYGPGTELACFLSSVRLATFPSTLL